MMIESDSEAQGTHLLLIVVKNDKVTIDSIVLCDQVEKRHSYVAKSDEILTLHLLAVGVLTGAIIESVTWIGITVDIVTNFKDSALSLQVVKDLSIHLYLELVSFLEDWIKAIVKHPC